MFVLIPKEKGSSIKESLSACEARNIRTQQAIAVTATIGIITFTSFGLMIFISFF